MRAPLVCQCESRTSLLVVPFLEANKHPDPPTYTDHNASHLLGMSIIALFPLHKNRGFGLYLASQVEVIVGWN